MGDKDDRETKRSGERGFDKEDLETRGSGARGRSRDDSVAVSGDRLPLTPSPRLPLNVYLCGMIGSGKTAIGERLATRLGRAFYDLDGEMDRELGYSFHRLVQEQGWLAFREMEYDICKRFAGMPGIVAALGGGTPRYAWNRDVLRGTGITILLDADQKTLAERVRRADRPRVNPGVSLEEDLERIWSTAGHLYRQAADVVYRTDAGKDIDAEVGDLLTLVAARGITRPERCSPPNISPQNAQDAQIDSSTS